MGWYGAAAVIVAYCLINFWGISVHSYLYLLINLSGMVGILVDALYHKAYESVVVNLIFVFITIVALISI